MSKEIDTLTNTELLAVKDDIAAMATYRNNQLEKKKKRHESIDFENTNPAFQALNDEVQKELTKRGL